MAELKIAGIVLAAGTSSRMGQNKLALQWGSSTVLESTMMKMANANFDYKLIVLGFESEFWQARWTNKPEFDWDIAINHNFLSGQGTSVVTGVQGAIAKWQLDAICFCLGDQPLLETNTIKDLITAWKANPDKIIVPEFAGKRGNPVIFPSWTFQEIMDLTGDAGARKLLKIYNQQIEYLQVDDRGVGVDLDTPETYRQELDKIKNKF